MYLCGLVNIVYQSLHNKHNITQTLNLLSEDQPITFWDAGKANKHLKVIFLFFFNYVLFPL
jgi:hypothetical protein